MDNEIMARSLLDQYERSLHMFRDAIINFPAEEWRVGELDYLRPAGVAYHVLETIEFYTGDKPASEFNWGERFGCDWEDPDTSVLPSKEQVLAYLDEIWPASKTWIASQDLFQSETIFRWTGETINSRLLYLLRHIQHHTAEMSLELKRRGFNCPDWQ